MYQQQSLTGNYVASKRLHKSIVNKSQGVFCAVVSAVESPLMSQNSSKKSLFFIMLLMMSAMILNMAFIKNAAADNQLQIVASIQPVQLLVNEITGISDSEQIPQATLLLNSNQNPQLQSLSSSQQALVSEANYVFYISDEFEKYMRAAKRSERSSRSIFKYIELGKLDGIRLLSIRQSGQMSHAFHGDIKPSLKPKVIKKKTGKKQGLHNHSDHDELGPDWHIWLNPDNAIVMLGKIRDVLLELDPNQNERYQRNYKNAVYRITVQSQRVAEKMMHVMKMPYLTVHDCYQYFEEQYGLKPVGSILSHHDQNPSIKRVAEVRELIEDHNVRHVLKESHVPTKTVAPVIEGFDAQIVNIDAAGSASSSQMRTYTDFIDDFAGVFYHGLIGEQLDGESVKK